MGQAAGMRGDAQTQATMQLAETVEKVGHAICERLDRLIGELAEAVAHVGTDGLESALSDVAHELRLARQ